MCSQKPLSSFKKTKANRIKHLEAGLIPSQTRSALD
jgi:hypothetical protein